MHSARLTMHLLMSRKPMAIRMPNKPQSFSYNSGSAKPLQMTDYSYDSKWRKLRDRRIEEEPLCRHCLSAGHVTPAVQVDHIRPRAEGGKDEWDNTQSLCLPCHQAKTAEETRLRMRGY
ncbi:HNH endonuclease [Sphingobium sp. B7D2B]|uniref:HNH endonuclease n=1 Tax=Sphingobium sp. B7D2B TaxID=2940583 RepID=UPI0039B3A8FD